MPEQVKHSRAVFLLFLRDISFSDDHIRCFVKLKAVASYRRNRGSRHLGGKKASLLAHRGHLEDRAWYRCYTISCCLYERMAFRLASVTYFIKATVVFCVFRHSLYYKIKVSRFLVISEQISDSNFIVKILFKIILTLFSPPFPSHNRQGVWPVSKPQWVIQYVFPYLLTLTVKIIISLVFGTSMTPKDISRIALFYLIYESLGTETALKFKF